MLCVPFLVPMSGITPAGFHVGLRWSSVLLRSTRISQGRWRHLHISAVVRAVLRYGARVCRSDHLTSWCAQVYVHPALAVLCAKHRGSAAMSFMLRAVPAFRPPQSKRETFDSVAVKSDLLPSYLAAELRCRVWWAAGIPSSWALAFKETHSQPHPQHTSARPTLGLTHL